MAFGSYETRLVYAPNLTQYVFTAHSDQNNVPRFCDEVVRHFNRNQSLQDTPHLDSATFGE